MYTFERQFISRAEQSRAEQSRAEQSRVYRFLDDFLGLIY